MRRPNSDTLCRFCLEPDIVAALITPCECKGTAKYVHKECLKSWIRITDIPEFKTLCQLCLTDYKFTRRWPLEKLFAESSSDAWYLLSRSYMFIILAYYTYFGCVAKMDVFYSPYSNDLCEYRDSYSCLYNSTVYRDLMMRWISWSILTIITSLYVCFYISVWMKLKNRKKYFSYFFAQNLHPNTFDPFSYFLILIILGTIGASVFVPFAAVYIFFLPKYIYIHNAILIKMNIDGENNLLE